MTWVMKAFPSLKKPDVFFLQFKVKKGMSYAKSIKFNMTKLDLDLIRVWCILLACEAIRQTKKFMMQNK